MSTNIGLLCYTTNSSVSPGFPSFPSPGHEGDEDPPGEIYWEPVLVWTGSYNPSRLAPRSRVNAVIIRDPDIAGAYQQEWCQIMSLSEAIDSRVDQINPEWGLGTS